MERRKKELVWDKDTSGVIDHVSAWLSGGTGKSSLLLYGGIGNGKTTVAVAIYRAASALSKTAKDNVAVQSNVAQVGPFSAIPSPCFVTAQQIVVAASGDTSITGTLANQGLLIIDDLGCEPVSAKTFGTEVTPIVDVLTRRYASMLPTIITTNLDLKDIFNRYGIRVYDRMIETFELIAFENKSYRK